MGLPEWLAVVLVAVGIAWAVIQGCLFVTDRQHRAEIRAITKDLMEAVVDHAAAKQSWIDAMSRAQQRRREEVIGWKQRFDEAIAISKAYGNGMDQQLAELRSDLSDFGKLDEVNATIEARRLKERSPL